MHADHTPSLFMDEEMFGYCFVCGWSGTIVEVMQARGYSGRDLLFKQDEFLALSGWGNGPLRGGETETGLLRPISGWEPAAPSLPVHLPLVRARWAFLLDRGYTLKTLARFATQSWKGVIFGWPVGEKWVTRWLMGDGSKYLYDSGFSRASLVEANVGDFTHRDAVIVVEGILDAAKIWQALHQTTVIAAVVAATLGSPTYSQIRQLQGYKRVYEAFDNDQGGEAAREMLNRRGVAAKRIHYYGGDPGECSDTALVHAVLEGVG